MNIFENYLSIINKIILGNQDILKLKNIKNLNNVNLEVPPEHFNFDLSTNVCLILSKDNQINPKDLANNLKNLLLKEIKDFENIEIAGPGFLNIKLSKNGLVTNINEIFKNKDSMEQKILIKNIISSLYPLILQGPCMSVIVEERFWRCFV